MQNITIREIEIHYSRPNIDDMAVITTSESAANLFRSSIDNRKLDFKEFFWVMLLSSSQHVLGIAQISVGGTSETAVNTKEIFQLALKGNAPRVILCHNHPNGSLTPSSQDISLTSKIHTFGKMIGVTIIDHIVLTSEGYYSFADNGMI